MASSSSSSSSYSSSLSILLFYIITLCLSDASTTTPANTTLHLTIRKDWTTSQYYTTLQIANNFVDVVIDLGGQTTWINCNGYFSFWNRPVPCRSKLCRTLKGSTCLSCNGPTQTGCTNNTCGSTTYSPYLNITGSQGFLTDRLTTLSTDGQFTLFTNGFNTYALSCVASNMLGNLASGTRGMLGLARTKGSLPSQLSLAFELPYKFALCLPFSTTASSDGEPGYGDIFVGGGPYIYPAGSGNIQDLSKSLTTTPLVRNPVSTATVYTKGDRSDEYFIGVRSIRIDDKAINIKKSLLKINGKGKGGTKLSTIPRYTVLHNSIYRAFIQSYVTAAASKNMTRVAPVDQFEGCFSSNGANGTVPYVDLVLQNESVKWRFYEENLMVKFNDDLMCLGIMDGGLNPRTAVVLGGHQLENYVLEFDLVSSKLGFSTSLLKINASCSNFRVGDDQT